jgi:hypothetical protein
MSSPTPTNKPPTPSTTADDVAHPAKLITAMIAPKAKILPAIADPFFFYL